MILMKKLSKQDSNLKISINFTAYFMIKCIIVQRFYFVDVEYYKYRILWKTN